MPIEKIVTRYVRSMANLGAVIPIADRVYIYDNSIDGEQARLCVRTQDGLIRKIYEELPSWIDDVIAGLARHADFVDMRVA